MGQTGTLKNQIRMISGPETMPSGKPPTQNSQSDKSPEEAMAEYKALLASVPEAVIRKAWFTMSHLILPSGAKVVDIGSSTLDFAYIVDGRETGVGTFGETALGGGLLDAALLRRAVERSRDRAALRSVLSESRSWYSYCEIEARRLKEQYYLRAAEDAAAPR